MPADGLSPEQRADAVARLFLTAGQRVYDQACPACRAEVRAAGSLLTRTPCAQGDCPDLTPARREWLAAHRPAPRRRPPGP